MKSPFRWPTLWLVVALLANLRPVEAAGRVKLEIFSDERAPVTSQQQWLRQLAAAGITDIRIRAGQAVERVAIDVQGTESDPLYMVTGMITSSNELVLPGRRFRITEAPQVARWIEELARKGLKEEEPTAAFGLSAGQFEKVQKDLAQAVEFSTKGSDRVLAARKIGEQLAYSLRIPKGQLQSAGEDDKVAEELSGLSCGTALACLLRPAGLGLVPYAGDRGAIEYRVLAAEKGVDIWPVGWPPEKPLPQILPAMYESFNANVQDVPVATVLEAVTQRMKIPYLLDHNALARHDIEPDKKKVNAPQSRTTYNQLLRKVLSQAGLKGEVRLDEAGKPFLWVTSVKPL